MGGYRHNVRRGRAFGARAALAVLAILLGFLPAEAAGGHWTMSAVDGAAMLTSDGVKFYAASQGFPVPDGTTVITGDDGTVVLVRRGDSITVFPNSEVTIRADAESERLGVLQNFGELLFRMETRESRNFEVRTPFLAATVKGTVFTVMVASTHAEVSVAEGMVRVTPADGGRGEMVHPGWTATAEIDGGLVGLARNRKDRTGRVMGPDALASGDAASGDTASGDTDSGDTDSGDTDSGDTDSGDTDSGDTESGEADTDASNTDGPANGNSKSGKSKSDKSKPDKSKPGKSSSNAGGRGSPGGPSR